MEYRSINCYSKRKSVEFSSRKLQLEESQQSPEVETSARVKLVESRSRKLKLEESQ